MAIHTRLRLHESTVRVKVGPFRCNDAGKRVPIGLFLLFLFASSIVRRLSVKPSCGIHKCNEILVLLSS